MKIYLANYLAFESIVDLVTFGYVCGNLKYANTFDNKRADFYRGHFMKEMNRMLKFLSNIPYQTDWHVANFSDFHNMEFE